MQHTTDVGKSIVANNQRSRDEEPDHTLQDVVDDKVAIEISWSAWVRLKADWPSLSLLTLRQRSTEESCGPNRIARIDA